MKYFLQSKQKNNSKLQYQAGFTLIETLVAVSILLLAILGPLAIASKGLNTAIVARDQVTAFYLAEQAIEYLKNVRDTNAINGNDWDTYISDCETSRGCTIDVVNISGPSSAIQQCGARRCNPFLKDASGRFNYANGETTQFTQKVVVAETGNDDERKVTVTMTWQSLGQSRSFTIQENLFNVY